MNIKIALDQLVRDGELTSKQRNTLLADMTDDVAELVLENNRAQTLALMIAREQALSMVNVHAATSTRSRPRASSIGSWNSSRATSRSPSDRAPAAVWARPISR